MLTGKFTSIVFACLTVILLIGSAGTSPAATVPTKLNISMVTSTVVEEPFNTCFVQALERIKEAAPHGLTINFDISENVQTPDCERVLRQIAKTGKYDIIWAHSSYGDIVKKLHSDFPEIFWGISGAANEPAGGNTYYGDIYLHEAGYLLGMIAGSMTKSNVIGAVAGYPYPAVTVPVNGYIAGAKAINPDIKVKITFIESWFDPPKAKESALAQIAAGADFIYAERFGPFEACKEKGKYAFGHWVDQNSLAPEVVISSTMAIWDPVINHAIDQWWNHETKEAPYNAPDKIIIYSMKNGASDIAPYHKLSSVIPSSLKKMVEKKKQDIIEGKIVVPINAEKPSSN